MGKLFEPKTEAINNEIAARARKQHDMDLGIHGIINPWIGIYYLHDEGRTIFASDNTIVPQNNWDANEPNNVNNGEDCVHLYNHEPRLKECNSYYTKTLIANGVCNDESNTEECKWDGGDCCGDDVVVTACLACECLEPFRWNDDNCDEFRRFICEKEGTG